MLVVVVSYTVIPSTTIHIDIATISIGMYHYVTLRLYDTVDWVKLRIITHIMLDRLGAVCAGRFLSRPGKRKRGPSMMHMIH
jgi:hypothetical protein